MSKILLGIKLFFVGALATIGGLFGAHHNLGTATVTAGNNYPNSSYTFNDNDIINAGDLNLITTYTGIYPSTDTVSLQGQIYNASKTFNTDFPSGILRIQNGGTGQSATGTAGQVLTSNGDGTTSFKAAAAVAGTSTNIQYNESGVLAATSTFGFNSSTQRFSNNAPSSSAVIGSLFANINLNNSVNFTYTGAIQSWTAPSNTTGTATFTLIGAGGGGNNPGKGAALTGTFTPTANQTYYITIGQVGAANSSSNTFGGGAGQGAGSPDAASGGGMSSISTTSTFTPTSSLIAVAGGGGGGSNNGTGSNGGTPNGQAGNNGNNGATGGGGGTQSSGGTAGAGTGGGGTGVSGSVGVGGKGGDAGGGVGEPGSGGGGGYFGGGGGGGNPNGSGGTNIVAGGGGGSSFFASTVTATSSAATSTAANGFASISYQVYTTSISSGTFAIAGAGHYVTGGPTPSVSGCGGACTIAGNDTAAAVTNSSSTTSFTETFANPFIAAPICQAQIASGSATAFKATSTVSAVTVTATTTIATSSITNIICLAY